MTPYRHKDECCYYCSCGLEEEDSKILEIASKELYGILTNEKSSPSEKTELLEQFIILYKNPRYLAVMFFFYMQRRDSIPGILETLDVVKKLISKMEKQDEKSK